MLNKIIILNLMRLFFKQIRSRNGYYFKMHYYDLQHNKVSCCFVMKFIHCCKANNINFLFH